nr:MAG TPA: Pplase1 alpha-glutamyl/putrescinyl thymine pyrophosphorylase clade 1 [Caudoviricetes sp.]
MRIKPRDKLYCGVNRALIRAANPKYNFENMQRFYDFVTERYKIHLRKDVLHKEAPWTNDGVLQQYKFCNVRREHDRQSQYIIKNISTNPCLSLEDKIVNSFYFRAWNNWDTMKDLGGPWTAKDLYSSQMKQQIRPIYQELATEDPDRKWWSSAYNQGGTKQAWRYPNQNEKINKEYDIPLRVFHIGPWLKEHNTVEKLLNANDQKVAFEAIKEIQGFADFLAYQVFVDLTYIKEFPFSENEFVIAGPGCKKGLDYLFDDYDGMSPEEALFWLRNNVDHIFSKIMTPNGQYWDPRELFIDLPEYDRCLNIMSLENCMCELAKYIRTIEGTGRPRVKYKQHK